jgi:O-antigen ligase
MKLNYLVCLFLPVYFATKLLWDTTIPYLFELLSWGLLAFAFAYSFSHVKIKTSLIVGYMLFCSYIVARGIMGGNTSWLVRGMYEYLFYSSFFWAVLFYVGTIDLRNIFLAFSFVGVLIAVLSFWEYAHGSYILGGTYESDYISWEGDTSIAFRTKVFTRSYLSHGIILGVATLVSFYLYKHEQKLRFLLAALLSYFGIFTTQSRGPLVATTVALGLCWLALHPRKRKKILLFSICCSPFFILFLFSSIQTGIPLLDFYLHRIQSIFNWTGDAGNLGRIVLWLNALQMWSESIWTGIGVSATGSWGEASLTVTESGVLKRLVETGIIGFVSYYGFLTLLVYNILVKLKNLTKEKYLETILCLGVAVCVLIDDITLQVTEEVMVAFFLWFALAVAYRNTHTLRFRRDWI